MEEKPSVLINPFDLDYESNKNFYENLDHISQLEKILKKCGKLNYKFGDLIRIHEYRDKLTYMIGDNGKLIKSVGDNNYLFIKYDITYKYNDATKRYPVDEYFYEEIELRSDDKLVLKTFNCTKEDIYSLPEKHNFLYIYYPLDNCICVQFDSIHNQNYYLNEIHYLENIIEDYEDYY